MSKAHSIMFAFATVSLFIALSTHPELGKPGAIWMIAPIMVFLPYGLIEAIKYWYEKEPLNRSSED